MAFKGKSFGGLFKTPKHKKFNYNPMFYDADAERLEQRKSFIEREVEREREAERQGKPSLEESMDMNWTRNYRKKTIVQSNYRLIVIFLVLVVVFWVYLMGT